MLSVSLSLSPALQHFVVYFSEDCVVTKVCYSPLSVPSTPLYCLPTAAPSLCSVVFTYFWVTQLSTACLSYVPRPTVPINKLSIEPSQRSAPAPLAPPAFDSCQNASIEQMIKCATVCAPLTPASLYCPSPFAAFSSTFADSFHCLSSKPFKSINAFRS